MPIKEPGGKPISRSKAALAVGILGSFLASGCSKLLSVVTPTQRSAVEMTLGKGIQDVDVYVKELPDSTAFTTSTTTTDPDFAEYERRNTSEDENGEVRLPPYSLASDDNVKYDSKTDLVILDNDFKLCIPSTNSCRRNRSRTVYVLRGSNPRGKNINGERGIRFGSKYVKMSRATQMTVYSLISALMNMSEGNIDAQCTNAQSGRLRLSKFISRIDRALLMPALGKLFPLNSGYLRYQDVKSVEKRLTDYNLAKQGCITGVFAKRALKRGEIILRKLGMLPGKQI